MMQTQPLRLAIVVSHPIQYCVPLYRGLAKRDDLKSKVFFTWHDAAGPERDPGFKRAFKWDIPLTEGYEYELVPNRSRNPGTHHFWGLRNPELVRRVTDWRPDAVHITGYAYASHLNAIRSFRRRGVPLLFRGDSHLLNEQRHGLRWELKRFLLNRIYRQVAALLYVGKHNYNYYRAFGVPDSKLFYCPHSIEVERFSESNEQLEARAQAWRRELSIPAGASVLLYAGKFDPVKQPIKLMTAVSRIDSNLVLLMVGNGQSEPDVKQLASKAPAKFRILPFQNQSLMPVVYRLGDIFVLPSASETWGLGVNEALASGRRVLLSDRVGCAPDLIRSEMHGEVFGWNDWDDFETKARRMLARQYDGTTLRSYAREFDVSVTERTLCETLTQVLATFSNQGRFI
jgi:Glycosyltransferase